MGDGFFAVGNRWSIAPNEGLIFNQTRFINDLYLLFENADLVI